MADNVDTISSSSSDELITNKSIEFLETSFVKLEDSAEDKQLHKRAFVDFIRQSMADYNSQEIDTFSLMFSSPTSFREDIENCIQFAGTRGVKDLSLDFHNPIWAENDLENHPAEFTLSTEAHYCNWTALESLKLFSCGFFAREMNNFKGLKLLSLGWIELSLDTIKDLLNACSLLKSLSLKKCWNNDHLHIPGPNARLETLVIDKCNFHESTFGIGIQNLRVFRYRGRAGLFNFFETPLSLVEAELDFAIEFQFQSRFGGRFVLLSLLAELTSVSVLTVCSYLLQVVPRGVDNDKFGLSTRLSVSHLSLKTAVHSNEFCGIMFMLTSCPDLETLTIHICPPRILHGYDPRRRFNPQEFWIKHFLVYECIEETLRVVEVNGFRGSVYELLLLKYLVGFGSIMEEVNIYISEEVDVNGGNNGEAYFLQRAQLVLRFTKASDNLQISIH